MKKKYIIPIFVPHEGCRNKCVFCNQNRITQRLEPIDSKMVSSLIDFYLELYPVDFPLEVAFYGGSFSGIDLERQKKLLDAVKSHSQRERINSIRISTRPDLINEEIISFLKLKGVSTIELGIQSSDEEVLKKSKRGHSFSDVLEASSLIHSYGLQLGVQMMIGLPGDTIVKSTKTAFDLARLNPSIARIYPVIAIDNTELKDMSDEGVYKPLSLNDAIERSAIAYSIFLSNRIDVIRLGLQANEEISHQKMIEGPYHPAFRTLVESRMILDYLRSNHITYKGNWVVASNDAYLSNIVGIKGSNRKALEILGIRIGKFVKDNSLEFGDIVLNCNGYSDFIMRTDVLKYWSAKGLYLLKS